MSHRSDILHQLLEEVDQRRGSSQPTTVVFDLDSTLFCVSPRTEKILRELGADPEVVRAYPAEAEVLRRVETTPVDWGIRSVLEREQLRSTIDFFDLVRRRWSEAFFSSEHLHADQPYEGAVEFVQDLASRGARIRYLTGRDVPRMGPGTMATLKRWGLPLHDEAHLHMKPHSERHDAEFKKEILAELDVREPGLWFFENEPVIVNLVLQHLPHLKVVFMDSVHSGREVAPDHLPRLKMSFRR